VADTPDLGNCTGKAGAANLQASMAGQGEAIEQLLLDRLDCHVRLGAGAHDVLQPPRAVRCPHPTDHHRNLRRGLQFRSQLSPVVLHRVAQRRSLSRVGRDIA